MSNTLYDVVVLPDAQLAQRATAASQMLQQFDSIFILKDGEIFPHISLFMLQLEADGIAEAKETLAQIARTTAVLSLSAQRYDHTVGFVDVTYDKTSELIALQEHVIAALNSMRRGMSSLDSERMKTAQGVALANFQTYGYKYVGELFRPHMTFTRLRETNPEAIAALGDAQVFNGTFTKLGLFEVGDNGTCIHEVVAYNLRAA